MLKRFVVFAPLLAYPFGGWEDVLKDDAGEIRSFDTQEEAARIGVQETANASRGLHTVDLQTGEMVVIKPTVFG